MGMHTRLPIRFFVAQKEAGPQADTQESMCWPNAEKSYYKPQHCAHHAIHVLKTSLKRIRLLHKHFPRNYKFKKNLNKSTVKVNYSWMSNIKTKSSGIKWKYNCTRKMPHEWWTLNNVVSAYVSKYNLPSIFYKLFQNIFNKKQEKN